MSLSRRELGLVLAAGLMAPGAALAQGAKASSAVELARTSESLKPGQWVWAPQIAPKGPVVVHVDLSRQLATVYRNGVRIAVSTVSSGKEGHETPTGVFTILQKDADHRSSLYNSAPMPYQQRLTWDGVALHAGGLPGYPESHGCVHLPMGFAKLLFGITPMGGTVIVVGKAGDPPADMPSAAGVLGMPMNAGFEDGAEPPPYGEDWRWAPEAAPTGPVTIIASRSDSRAVVLRNGVEIGRAGVVFPDEDFQTHVLVCTGVEGGVPRWAYVGAPGHEDEADRPLDPELMAKTRMPDGFRKAVRTVIVPGTTILATQSPVLPDTTGKHLTVLSSGR
ncbi:L,D-transpeptidase [Caulobacter sp. CCNWLY153]|uniref:L,D-transpeptidase n=1 Tax=unclassified Caulobacter TaxID=2648921 RepID=UPI002FEEF865